MRGIGGIGGIEGEDELALDIGVDATQPQKGQPMHLGRTQAEHRSLPVWAFVAMALLVGWLLGTLMSAGPAHPVVAESDRTFALPALAATFPPPHPPVANQEGPVEAVYEQFEPRPVGGEEVVVVMVQAPLRGVAIPAQITVIDQGVATQIDLDRLIAGVSQGVIGQGDQRMLVVDDAVIFMSLDSVMAFDPFEKTEPTKIAQAIYLLPGSGSGRAWAVTSGSQSVLNIDVQDRRVIAEYDMTLVGAPLGSFDGGLVVAPANRTLGKFALWNPRRGIERIWTVDERSSFIDAAGTVLVIRTPQGLASYDTVTGSLNQTDVAISASQQHRAFVSPDGARLAVVERGSVAELPIVRVIDLASGETIDEFTTAFEWQLRWLNPNEIMFMEPLPKAVRVMLRDTTDQSSRSITDLAGPNYWVTIAE